jgi:hypothetical protein
MLRSSENSKDEEFIEILEHKFFKGLSGIISKDELQLQCPSLFTEDGKYFKLQKGISSCHEFNLLGAEINFGG